MPSSSSELSQSSTTWQLLCLNLTMTPSAVNTLSRSWILLLDLQLCWSLASFPGSCVWVKKKAWYTLFAHVQFPQDFWEFGKICSITLTSMSHANFSRIKAVCHWPRSVWTMTREQWRYSALRLQELFMRSSIPAKRCGTWLTAILPFEVHRSPQMKQCRLLPSSFWLQNHLYVCHRSITM